MSLSESLVREDEEPPDSDAVGVTESDESREKDRTRTDHSSERRVAEQVEASARAPRQFETHCVLRLCNAVDDENAVTAVEVMRSTGDRTRGATSQ